MCFYGNIKNTLFSYYMPNMQKKIIHEYSMKIKFMFFVFVFWYGFITLTNSFACSYMHNIEILF